MKMDAQRRDKSGVIGVDAKGFKRAPVHRGYFGRNRAWVSPLVVAFLALAMPSLMALFEQTWPPKVPTAVAMIGFVVAGIGASITQTTSAMYLRLVAVAGGLCLLLVIVYRFVASAL